MLIIHQEHWVKHGRRPHLVLWAAPYPAHCGAYDLRKLRDALIALLATLGFRTMIQRFETLLRVMRYEASRIYRGLLDLPEDWVGPKFREMIGIGLTLSETTYRDDRTRLVATRARFWGQSR